MRANIADYNAVVEAASKFTRSEFLDERGGLFTTVGFPVFVRRVKAGDENMSDILHPEDCARFLEREH